MPRTCAASFCQTNWQNVNKRGISISFHQFPSDNVLCEKWIAFCNRSNNWKPTQHSALCSIHFKTEDYQLIKSISTKNNLNFKMLKLTAVPSIVKDETEVYEDSEFFADYQGHAMLLKYRDEFCRTCLRRCKDELLISVDSHIQNMTVLDMLMQLTAFETENNDAFPRVICLECKNNLVQAFNIRQEFSAQLEHLVRLVAEQKIMEYYKKFVEHYDWIAPRLTEEPYFTNMKLGMNSTGTVSTNDCSSMDDVILDFDHETQHTRHENADNVIANQQSHIPDLNDHSCYTKITKQVDLGIDSQKETSVGKSATEDEDTSARLFNNKIEMNHGQTKHNASHKTLKRKAASGINQHNKKEARKTKHEKTSTARQKAGLRRVLKRQHNEASQSKVRILEQEARERFPLTTCYVCLTKHNTLVERDFHMQEHVSMLPYQCKECLADDGTNSTLKSDDNKASENLVKDQPDILKTTNQLNLHFRMHWMPHKCEKCYRSFSTLMKLKTHMWAFHKFAANGMTCEYCGKQYFRRIAFRKHINTHKKKLSGEFKCSVCDRTFGVKSSLQRHEASHKGERKYTCMYCDKSFSTSYNRLTHQRNHIGKRPFKCLHCDQTFVQDRMLKAHQVVCTTDAIRALSRRICGPPLLPSKDGHCPYPECDYTTTSYRAMYAHKRAKHMPLYRCEECDKPFAFKSKLTDHMMLHTGEKPHKCELCGRCFRRLEMYRRHLQTHTADSNHICTLCQKGFKLPQYLQAHMLTHSAERKFACEICGNSYKTKGELKKHSQRKHGEETIENVIVEAENAVEDEIIEEKEEENYEFLL